MYFFGTPPRFAARVQASVVPRRKILIHFFHLFSVILNIIVLWYRHRCNKAYMQVEVSPKLVIVRIKAPRILPLRWRVGQGWHYRQTNEYLSNTAFWSSTSCPQPLNNTDNQFERVEQSDSTFWNVKLKQIVHEGNSKCKLGSKTWCRMYLLWRPNLAFNEITYIYDTYRIHSNINDSLVLFHCTSSSIFPDFRLILGPLRQVVALIGSLKVYILSILQTILHHN